MFNTAWKTVKTFNSVKNYCSHRIWTHCLVYWPCVEYREPTPQYKGPFVNPRQVSCIINLSGQLLGLNHIVCWIPTFQQTLQLPS